MRVLSPSTQRTPKCSQPGLPCSRLSTVDAPERQHAPRIRPKCWKLSTNCRRARGSTPKGWTGRSREFGPSSHIHGFHYRVTRSQYHWSLFQYCRDEGTSEYSGTVQDRARECSSIRHGGQGLGWESQCRFTPLGIGSLFTGTHTNIWHRQLTLSCFRNIAATLGTSGSGTYAWWAGTGAYFDEIVGTDTDTGTSAWWAGAGTYFDEIIGTGTDTGT